MLDPLTQCILVRLSSRHIRRSFSGLRPDWDGHRSGPLDREETRACARTACTGGQSALLLAKLVSTFAMAQPERRPFGRRPWSMGRFDPQLDSLRLVVYCFKPTNDRAGESYRPTSPGRLYYGHSISQHGPSDMPSPPPPQANIGPLSTGYNNRARAGLLRILIPIKIPLPIPAISCRS